MLTKEEYGNIKKYMVRYNGDENARKIVEKDREKEDRQYELYRKIKKKTIRNTAIRELISMTEKEIQTQYRRKEQFENRSGFALALWGILFGVCIQTEILGKFNNLTLSRGIVTILIVVISVIDFYFISKSLLSTVVYHFAFEDTKYNFNCAVDDKDCFYIATLEALTDVWERNEKMINIKARYFDKSVYLLAVFALLILVMYFIK